jgi:hypothetical protein
LVSDFGRPRFAWQQLFPIALLCLFGVMITEAVSWNPLARIVPLIVGSGAILFCSLVLVTDLFKRGAGKQSSLDEIAKAQVQQKMHMDIKSSISHLPVRTLLLRGGMFFGWMVLFLISMATIGIIMTVPLFIVAFMRLEAHEPWRLVVPMAAIMCVFIYYLFDQTLAIPWPPTVLADYFPDDFPNLQIWVVRAASVIVALSLGYVLYLLLQKLANHIGLSRKRESGARP